MEFVVIWTTDAFQIPIQLFKRINLLSQHACLTVELVSQYPTFPPRICLIRFCQQLMQLLNFLCLFHILFDHIASLQIQLVIFLP